MCGGISDSGDHGGFDRLERHYGDGTAGGLCDRAGSTCARAIEYSEEYPNTVLVLSGGKGPGEEISEARAMYEYLQYNGIPEDKLLIEDQSSDTVQNIEFSRTVIDRQEYNKAQAARAHLMEFYRERPDGDTIRIGILTSNYHVFRAEAIARRQEIEPVGVAAACDPVLAVHLWLREAFAVLKDKFMGRL